MLYKMDLHTRQHTQMIDISAQLKELLNKSGIKDGLLLVYCPHTTAGVTINENADPKVIHDVLMRLEEMAPWEHKRDRHGEGNSAAHLKASLIGFSQYIPVCGGRLLLGTWQGVYFCEFDGPRQRSYYVYIKSD
ncbi:MAG TPA: hypothetical protein DER60_11625 [Syntrophomonas sp.]|jgi:secondary thiamine-phosphate synthase enzyme|nr:hypothetical protein [Syntrophomonas sp.]